MTAALIGVNVAIYLIQLVTPVLLNAMAFNPYWAYVEPWRLLTSSFLHSGFMHLLFNMLMLYLLGTSVERALGWWRYLAVYLLSALGGSMLIIAWVFAAPQSINSWTVGASGAIYGMFGALLILQKRAGMSTNSILILLGVNLIYGFVMPNVSWQGHIGGFLGGLVATLMLVKILDRFRRRGPKAVTTWSLVGIVALSAAMGAGTWGMYALMF